MKPSWGKAALALAAGQSNADAAKAAGVTSRTVARWRADEVAFADRIEDLRSGMLTEAAGLLAHATTAAAVRLAEINFTASIAQANAQKNGMSRPF